MPPEEKKELMARIDAALDHIRPHLFADGGNIELVDVTEEMVVQINWLGNCKDCSMSSMTMRAGVEQALKSSVPEVRGVVALNGVNA